MAVKLMVDAFMRKVDLEKQFLSFYYLEQYYLKLSECFPSRHLGALMLAKIFVDDMASLAKSPPYPEEYYALKERTDGRNASFQLAGICFLIFSLFFADKTKNLLRFYSEEGLIR